MGFKGVEPEVDVRPRERMFGRSTLDFSTCGHHRHYPDASRSGWVRERGEVIDQNMRGPSSNAQCTLTSVTNPVKVSRDKNVSMTKENLAARSIERRVESASRTLTED